MSVESEIKDIILRDYKSVRAFSIENDIPYSTVDNIFKRGIGSLGFFTTKKICDILNLDINSIAIGIVKTKEPSTANGEELSKNSKVIEGIRKLESLSAENQDVALKLLDALANQEQK